MCNIWPQQLFDLRQVFNFLCAIITLILIYQELVAFAITRPTSNFKEEKKLETRDIPEVVICFEPGFDSKILNRYGYNTDTYYRGSMDQKSFVGWNGGGNENKSSQDILEDVLVAKIQHLNQSTFVEAYYTEDYDSWVSVEVKMRILAYPLGRCISISSPPSHNNLNTLSVSLNKTAFNFFKVTAYKIRVMFMDKANSLRLYPNNLDMMGDRIKISTRRPSSTISYKTKVSRFQHVQGDPLFRCAVYTTDNSYNDCIQDELLEPIEKEIGCQPPLLAKDQNLMCNQKFNFSTADQNKKIKRLFKPLYYHDTSFNCRTPCTTNVYTTKYVQSTPSSVENMTYLVLEFDKTLEVGHSTFSIDGQTFVTRLGGSVSSGRTLLWILISLFGAVQVIQIFDF